jgi:hypothetical protein
MKSEATQPVDYPPAEMLGVAKQVLNNQRVEKGYALSQPQAETAQPEALTQVEGACLRIEMVSQAMRKGDPSSGLLNEAVATIRAALAGRTTK